MHIDEGANVQHCQSVRGQMSVHAILRQGANVRGRDMSYTLLFCSDCSRDDKQGSSFENMEK